MRVLLIDDHALVRKGIEELLQSRGVQVVAAVGSGEEGVRRDFLNEVTGWATSYEPPTFGRDEKNLVKLKSFLSAKLP